MIRIAVDGMGGDKAPEQIVIGTMDALNKFSDIEVTLFGDENLMKPYLTQHPRLKVVHTPKFLDMGIKDVGRDTLRNDKDASMLMALQFVKDGHADALVSAGPTQALIFCSYFLIKPMKEMTRVAIAPMVPHLSGTPSMLLDAGGNIDAKPEHLVDFAVFASVALEEVYGVKNPKVGLINIGTEKGKGRELEQVTYDLLEQHPNVNFIGNIETKELLDGEANIFISDGFTANIVMKTIEGTAKSLGTLLKREIKSSFISKLAAVLFLKKPLTKFKKSLSPDEVGGALIAGLEKTVIKAHGSSNAYAFHNAIRQAKIMVEKDVIGKVKKELGEKR